MNRYTLEGVQRDAKAGKRISVVLPRAVDVANWVSELEDDPAARRVHRTNGLERVEYENGGLVLLHGDGRPRRGHSVDVLVLSGQLSDESVRVAVPAVVASPIGEVIRA